MHSQTDWRRVSKRQTEARRSTFGALAPAWRRQRRSCSQALGQGVSSLNKLEMIATQSQRVPD